MKGFTKYLFLFFTWQFSFTAFCQNVVKTYGGNNPETGYSLLQLVNGDFILVGDTRSYGPANANIYALRVNSNGDTLWTRVIGNGSENGYNVVLTKDSSLLFGHFQSSTAGYGANVKKLDLLGNINWSESYGVTAPMPADMRDIKRTVDKGFIGIGITTYSVAPLVDLFVFKADSFGQLQWGKHLQENKWEYGMSIEETPTGYVLTGYTNSYNNNSNNAYDALLMKLNKLGDTLWGKTYGDSLNSTEAFKVKPMPDGGFAVYGSTDAFSSGQKDFFLIRTDSSGNRIWSKTYGSVGPDNAEDFLALPQGGFLLMGNTPSVAHGNDWDILFVRTNDLGDTLWTKTFGGNYNDYGKQIIPISNGYAIMGTSYGLTSLSSSLDLLFFTMDTACNSDCFTHNAKIFIHNAPFKVVDVHSSLLNNVGYLGTSHGVTHGGNVIDWCNGTTVIKKHFKEEDVFVYPNPFSDKLCINFKAISGKKSITVFSATGNVIKQFTCKEDNCNLEREGILAGFYFIQIITDNGFSKRIKLIVE
ncbi:MAG TPA: T9SS type A sorting domain-containing protein [Bacteroidia bacterium]|jgi:hypothetical protein|nr:T9SS type A sorting domain-containing protein [Bacteroidia bacterium]